MINFLFVIVNLVTTLFIKDDGPNEDSNDDDKNWNSDGGNNNSNINSTLVTG